MIFDTHVHYDDEAFDEDREALLSSLPEHGIGVVVNISSDLASVKSTLALAGRYPYVYGAIGIHPSETAELDEERFAWLREMTQKDKVVAVGEIGLDYYWDEPEREVQKRWFDRQLALAREVGLPVVIHSRDAAQDTLDMMKAARAGETGGVIHCFSYGVEMAREYLNLGFYLGIGGVLTFKNGRKLKEVVEYMPLDRILLETDCPYLAPVPNRGKRNSSLNLPFVAEEIGRIKQIPADEVIAVTAHNARTMYRLPSAGQMRDLR